MRKGIQAVSVFAVLLLLWQGMVVLVHLPDYFLPSPWEVGVTLWQQRTILFAQAWPTALEALLGLVIAVVWGMLLGTLVVLSKWSRYFLLPILLVSQAVPTLAVAPLFVLWFGFDLNAKVALVIFSLFFPISIALYEGVRRMPRQWEEQATLMQASRWRKLVFLQWPAAWPAVASGIRMVSVWAPLAAVAGEWVGASRGLGFVMVNANSQLNTSLVFAAIFILMVVSLVLFYGVEWVTRKLL